MTCGPWRPINLEVYESRVADLHTRVHVADSLKSAEVVAHVAVEGSATRVRFNISLDGNDVASETTDVKDETSVTFAIQNPQLWYPVRYGKQPLYTITATLLDGDKEADSLYKRIGLRKAELVQDPLKDQPGTSFFFRVNNVPVFCGGSDWIPADNFIPRITKQKYYDWVKLIADGNQFMVRVWGGGIFEEQAFYDACDELGVLVWHDFMFGCGNYPVWPEMAKSIEREAAENVKLLRHHPSIVIWAGQQRGTTNTLRARSSSGTPRTRMQRVGSRPTSPLATSTRRSCLTCVRLWFQTPTTIREAPGAARIPRTLPWEISTSGMSGMARKKSIKTSTSSWAASSPSSAWRRSPRSRRSTHSCRSAKTTLTATRSLLPWTSTTKPMDTNAA